jgi:hypothetical protein
MKKKQLSKRKSRVIPLRVVEPRLNEVFKVDLDINNGVGVYGPQNVIYRSN